MTDSMWHQNRPRTQVPDMESLENCLSVGSPSQVIQKHRDDKCPGRGKLGDSHTWTELGCGTLSWNLAYI